MRRDGRCLISAFCLGLFCFKASPLDSLSVSSGKERLPNGFGKVRRLKNLRRLLSVSATESKEAISISKAGALEKESGPRTMEFDLMI